MDFSQSLSDHMPESSDPIAHNGKQNVLVYCIWQNLLKFLQGVLPSVSAYMWTFPKFEKLPFVVYYRPQTKFAKVMILHLSLILFTGGSTWAGTPSARYTPRAGAPLRQVHPPVDTPPAGTPGQVHLPRQVHLQALHTGIRSTSGRYASYWNAFLYWLMSMVFEHFIKRKPR